MSDDSFVREVDDELRQDQIKGLWSRYGFVIIAMALLVVVGTASYRGWEYWRAHQAAKTGDAYLAAVELSKSGKQNEAVAAFDALVKSGSGQYPALAQLRMATETLGSGNKPGAMAAFDVIAADTSFDAAFRSVAALRAALIAVDIESYDQVKIRLEPMAGAGAPYRSIAREALGLSAYKTGANDDAAKWFRQIADDANAIGNVRQRASLMLDLLAGRGVAGAS